LKNFQNTNPPVFSKTEEPLDADDWLQTMENNLEVAGVEDNEKVARIVLTDSSWEHSVYVYKLPNVLHEYFCNEIAHYKEPDTAESIVRDLTLGNISESDAIARIEKLGS
jgi:hypothetical protein